MPVSLRTIIPEDEPFLFEVYASTRREELAQWGLGAAEQTALLKMQFNAQRMAYAAQYEDAEHKIIQLDGKDIGRIMIDRSADAVHLIDISLLTEHRNTGIGGALIRGLLLEAAAAHKPVQLYVLKTNRARRLYERLGFRIIGDTGMHFTMECSNGARAEDVPED